MNSPLCPECSSKKIRFIDRNELECHSCGHTFEPPPELKGKGTPKEVRLKSEELSGTENDPSIIHRRAQNGGCPKCGNLRLLPAGEEWRIRGFRFNCRNCNRGIRLEEAQEWWDFLNDLLDECRKRAWLLQSLEAGICPFTLPQLARDWNGYREGKKSIAQLTGLKHCRQRLIDKDFPLGMTLERAGRILSEALSVALRMQGSLSNFKHSPDYRSVNLDGQQFTLSPVEAQVVETLHNNYLNGTPDVGQDYILENLGGWEQTTRLRDTFTHRGAFTALIESRSKGTYRLKI